MLETENEYGDRKRVERFEEKVLEKLNNRKAIWEDNNICYAMRCDGDWSKKEKNQFRFRWTHAQWSGRVFGVSLFGCLFGYGWEYQPSERWRVGLKLNDTDPYEFNHRHHFVLYTKEAGYKSLLWIYGQNFGTWGDVLR